MRIILIRHAGTETNRRGQLNGKLDEPILPESENLIFEAARKLPDGIKHIYCSPMKRTRQTAEIIRQVVKAPISYHAELVERDFGQMDGMTWDEGFQKFGPGYSLQKDLALDYDYSPIGGDKAGQVRERVQKFIEFAKAQATGEPVLVVTHGGVIRMILSIYLSMHIAEMPNLSAFDVEI